MRQPSGSATRCAERAARSALPAVAEHDGRRDHRRGARLRRAPSPARWAPTIEQRRPAGPRRLPRPGAAPAAADPSTPIAPALEGAYELGRGEARSGRSMDALLAAYRVGARVSWRELAAGAVAAGLTRRQWPSSPSWCSPTSTSCRRRASPATPTNWPPPAGSAGATWNGSAQRLLAGEPARRELPRPPPSGPTGRRRRP